MGKGKRGGLRTIVAYQAEGGAFFVYGYAKNVRSDINIKEKAAYKKMSKVFFSLEKQALEKLIKIGELIEVLP